MTGARGSGESWEIKVPRLYGFEDAAFRRVRDEEAAVLRQAASRILAGQTIAAVTESLNSMGHRTSMGKPWRPARLASVLDHPAIAGLAEVEDGGLVETGGPIIITPDEFREIRRLRAERRPAAGRSPQREYLLSGPQTVCGLCGKPLGAAPSNSGSRGYRCMPSTTQHPGGCGKVRVNADLLETHVAEHVLAELAKEGVAEALEGARRRLLDEVRQLRTSVAGDRERQSKLGIAYAGGEVSMASYKLADQELTQRIRDKSLDLRFMEQASSVPIGGVPDLVRWWQHAPFPSRKALIRLMLDGISVYPASARGSRTVDDDRVQLTWRSLADAPE